MEGRMENNENSTSKNEENEVLEPIKDLNTEKEVAEPNDLSEEKEVLEPDKDLNVEKEVSESKDFNEGKVVLEPIKALTNDEFKHKVLLYTVQNNPEFFIEASERNNLDSKRDQSLINDIVYKEQVMTLQALCREAALEENTMHAYDYLQVMCFFTDKDYAYVAAVEGENASTNLYTYIEERLKNIDDLKPTLDLISAVNDAYLYASAEMPNFNAYKANQIVEKMNENEAAFSDEQKAQAAYICSKMYRKLESSKQVYGEVLAGEKETEYLQKVLSHSSDYKLLAHCQSRLNKKAEKEVVRAYKRALQNNRDKKALYNINMALAGIYAQQSKQIGFASASSSKYMAGEKSVRYLINAYRYSQRDERMQILKQMSDVHLQMGHFDEWKNLKTVIALKYLKGEARCWALNAIGDKMQDAEYYKMAIEECKKSKIPDNVKLDIEEATYAKLIKATTSELDKTAYKDSLKQVRAQKQMMFLTLLNGKKKSKV